MNFECDWLNRWNQYSPQALALQDGETGTKWSYAELLEKSQSIAEWLKYSKGIQKGDRVALFALNELESIALFFGCQRLGAILVPINFRLTAPELSHIIEDCTPKLILFQPEFLKVVEPLNGVEKIEFQTLRQLGKPRQGVEFAAQPEDPCMIIYTSGTTGAPKGAVLTHEMIFWNSVNTTLRLNISQNDKTVIFLPLFHTGGWNVLTTPFLHRGASIILLKKFDADKILQLSASENCTLLFGVPTTMDMMARSSEFGKSDLSRIRYAIVGGEPMPVELIQTWHQKGIAIRQGYGLTEFGPNVFSLNETDAIRKIGSIGFPNFYIEAKVLDSNGKECAKNEIGELVLKGPTCMHGYWNHPEATRETIQDGWLRTGDLVRKDDEGYYYVVGRKKEMYKSGGENVYPAEIEKVLYSVPGVREAAVIGVKDPTWGEVGKAFVAIEAGASVTTESLHAHCLKNLAKFKIPKSFVIVDSLPKSESGKILKRKLLD